MKHVHIFLNRSGMSRYAALRQALKGLNFVCTGSLQDLKRQLAFGMACWPPPAAHLQYSGLASRLLISGKSFQALASRRHPAHLRTEKQLLHTSFASTSSSSYSVSEESDGRQSPMRRRSESRKGLQSVTGIGPRNEKLLMSKGIESVDRLKEVFLEKLRDENKMRNFLRVSNMTSSGRHFLKPC